MQGHPVGIPIESRTLVESNNRKKLRRKIPITIGRAKRRNYFAAKRRGWRESSVVLIALTRRA